MRKKILLIDASGLLFRSYFAMIKNPLRTASGIPTSAVYGALRMIFSAVRSFSPHLIISAFDVPRSSLKRTQIYSKYKANRQETPEDLIQQIAIFKECLQLCGVFSITYPGHEADDVLATLVEAYKSKVDVFLFTGDKDLLQVVEEGVSVVWPDKTLDTGFQVMDREGVKESKGVYPEEIPHYLAILGDVSDNIPGVKGIGKKGAEELLSQFHSLEDIYKNLDHIKPSFVKKLQESKDEAFLSLSLINLKKDLPINLPEIPAEVFTLQEFGTENFLKKLKELELFSLLKELSGFHDNSTAAQNLIFDTVQDLQQAERFTLTSLERFSQNTLGVGILLQDGYLYFGAEGVNIFLTDADLKQYGQLLSGFLDNLSEHDKLVVFDRKKIAHFFSSYDITLPECSDIKLMAYLLEPSRSNYTIENLSWSYLQKNDSTTAVFSVLREALGRKIVEQGMGKLYYHIEMPLRSILYKMEKLGVKIDISLLSEISQNLEKQLKILEEKIYGLAGKEFNILSPKQLANILFDDLGLKPQKKTKTKLYSTDEETLEMLSWTHPLPREILMYRSLSKFKNTYADVLSEKVDVNDRVHTTFHQTVTSTGRLSSSDPNLQNIPIRTDLGKEIRKAFIASEGRVLLSADYSQIELRLFACLSQDKTMQDFFMKGGDVHRQTASLMFGIKEDTVTEDQRRAAKTVNYGISYGMSAFRLSQELGIEFPEARRFIETYFDMFSGIKTFMQETLEFARDNGFVITMFGRRRPTRELLGKPIDKILNLSHVSRFAINAVVQGSAADIIKMSMLYVDHMIDHLYKGRADMILQVHDELLFEVDEELAESFKKDVTKLMVDVVDLPISLDVSAGIGRNWLEAH